MKRDYPKMLFGRNYKLAAVAVLFLLGALAYSNSFSGSFHFDDFGSITKNADIRNIWGLCRIWNFWPTRFITYLSVALNYKLGGLNVFGYHLFNFLAHFAAAVSVWWLSGLTLRIIAAKGNLPGPQAKSIPFFISAVFLLHPVQTQAVDYIIQRAVLLVAFFYISSLSLYARARIEAKDKKTFLIYYCGSLLMAFVAMFCKETAISLPFMVCLYEFAFLREKKEGSLKFLIPFFIVALVIPLVLLASRSVDFKDMKLAVEAGPNLPAGHYLLTQPRVALTYLRLVFLPLALNLDYDYPVFTTLFQAPVLLGISVLFAILIFAVLIFRRQRLASFGILWFFIALLPESSFIPIRDVIFEHRLYIALAGFGFFIVSSLYYIAGKIKKINPGPLFLALIVFYAVLTFQRNTVWKDEFSLWNDTAKKSPGKARPYVNRGMSLGLQKKYDLAIADFNRALSIKTDFAEAYNDRGAAYRNMKEYDLAIADISQALQINPDFAEAYNNRGLAYFEKKQYSLAAADFKQALRLEPDSAEIYNHIGNMYAAVNKRQQAAEYYKKAVEIDPLFSEAYNNLGLSYAAAGSHKEAILFFQKAIKADPKNAQAYLNLGGALGNLGDYEKSIGYLQEAGRKGEDSALVYGNLAIAYFYNKQYAPAIEHLDKAIRLGYKPNPDFLKALEPYRNK